MRFALSLITYFDKDLTLLNEKLWQNYIAVLPASLSAKQRAYNLSGRKVLGFHLTVTLK